MVDRNDRNFSQNEHTFIKETIKEPPINKKRIAEKLLLGDYEEAACLLNTHLEEARTSTFDSLLKNGPQYGI